MRWQCEFERPGAEVITGLREHKSCEDNEVYMAGILDRRRIMDIDIVDLVSDGEEEGGDVGTMEDRLYWMIVGMRLKSLNK